MADHFATDIVEFHRTHQMLTFLCDHYRSIGQSTYLYILLLFIMINFFNTVTLQLMISLVSSLLFAVSLTLLVLGCLLPLAGHTRIIRLLLSFATLMTF
jgi:hypothetical protein